MKNFKFVLFVLALLAIGMVFIVTYIEMPIPQKVKIQLLDVNDDEVK
jgi:hypothetical protein